MLVIGIAGGTGSGKTTVVNNIIRSLPQGEVAVLPQDAYYRDSSHIPLEQRSKINFDEPASIEWELLETHLSLLRQGKTIEMPTYSYLTCTRQAETVTIDADADDRLIRVISRDCIERGRTPQMVIDRYESVLKPMHQLYIEPSKRYADLIVPQGGNNRVAVNLLTHYIESRMGCVVDNK